MEAPIPPYLPTSVDSTDISLLCNLSNSASSPTEIVFPVISEVVKEREENEVNEQNATYSKPENTTEIQDIAVDRAEDVNEEVMEEEHNYNELTQTSTDELHETTPMAISSETLVEEIKKEEPLPEEIEGEEESAELLDALSQEPIMKDEDQENTSIVPIDSKMDEIDDSQGIQEESLEDSEIAPQSMEQPNTESNGDQINFTGGSSGALKLKIRLTAPTEANLPKEDLSIRIRLPKKRRPDSSTMDIEELRKYQDEAAARGEYCICGGPDNMGLMVCCDTCGLWCHAICMGLTDQDCAEMDNFQCPNCDVKFGKPRVKRGERHDITNRKSQRKRKVHNYSELNEAPMPGEKEIKAAVSFKTILKEKKFATDNLVKVMEGHELTLDYIEKEGLRVPIAVNNVEGLGMEVPSSSFTVENVKNLVGSSRIIDVIEVATQAEVNPQWTLGTWSDYYMKKGIKEKKYNVISLEVTNTKLAEKIRSPDIVRKIDWIETIWPKDATIWPKVQLYCLMSVAGAYTDFHIDFGGSSVWYHVVYGEKFFLFIPPTEENLKRYAEWSSSPDQSDVFFADKVEKCYMYRVYAGQTLFIPTGWIHAVYTPLDSLVFGGNFLHGYNIKQQLQIYDIENRTGVAPKFRFPLYELMMWYAAEKYLQRLKEHHKLTTWEYEGILHLVATLDSWLATTGETSEFIPKTITAPKTLLEELSSLILKEEQPQMDIDEEPWDAVIKSNCERNAFSVHIQEDVLARIDEIENKQREAATLNEEGKIKLRIRIPSVEALSSQDLAKDDEDFVITKEEVEQDGVYFPDEPVKTPKKKSKVEKKAKGNKPPTTKSPKPPKVKVKAPKTPKAAPPAPLTMPTTPTTANVTTSPFKTTPKKQGKPQSVRERIAKKLGVRVNRFM